MGNRIILKDSHWMMHGETFLGWTYDAALELPQDPTARMYFPAPLRWPTPASAGIISQGGMVIIDTQDEWHRAPLATLVAGEPGTTHTGGPSVSDVARAYRGHWREAADPAGTSRTVVSFAGPSDAEVVGALRAYWCLLDGLGPDDGHPIAYLDSEDGVLRWDHPTLGPVGVSMAEASAAWSRELRRLTDESEAARRPMEIERQPAVPEDL